MIPLLYSPEQATMGIYSSEPLESFLISPSSLCYIVHLLPYSLVPRPGYEWKLAKSLHGNNLATNIGAYMTQGRPHSLSPHLLPIFLSLHPLLCSLPLSHFIISLLLSLTTYPLNLSPYFPSLISLNSSP